MFWRWIRALYLYTYIRYIIAACSAQLDVIETASLNMCDQIMFNVDKAHMILDEMITNGQITETNKNRVLAPVAVLDRVSK